MVGEERVTSGNRAISPLSISVSEHGNSDPSTARLANANLCRLDTLTSLKNPHGVSFTVTSYFAIP